jgi:hypothetical protein
MLRLLAPFLFAVSANVVVDPCDSVSRSLPNDRKAQLSAIAAGQLNATRVEVPEYFQFAGWRIIYVVPPAADEAYLFYRGDPKPANFVTQWSGAARTDEQSEIERWVLHNAKGIPKHLASCFAYHVTLARTR